jgi:hypothetical protein
MARRLHLLIEPMTRLLASWNVVTPLLSVRAVPVTLCDRERSFPR